MTAHAVREEARLIVLVANDRAVEREVRRGAVAETRAAFVRRMVEALRPDVRFARVEEARIALGQSLVMEAGADPRLGKLAATAGPTWQRTLDSLHRTIGRLRASSIPVSTLVRIGRSKSPSAERARTLACAMGALDALLERAGLVDSRAAGTLLAEALTLAAPDRVRVVVGAPQVLARGIVQWEGADLAWFRALDVALGGQSGARIELPTMPSGDARLDGRNASPLDVVFDAVGHALDEPPLEVILESPLGDLRMAEEPPAIARTRIDLRKASDGDAAARATGDAVRAALDGEMESGGGAHARAGASLDGVVVAMARPDPSLAASLGRTFAELGIVASFSLATGWGEEAEASGSTGVVGVALTALEAGARGLDPTAIATLARSAYLDARTLTGAGERAPLHRIARAIEETPPMRVDNPLQGIRARLERWVTQRNEQQRRSTTDDAANVQVDMALADKLGAILLAPLEARTRGEQVNAARALFAGLGFDERVKRAVTRPLHLESTDETLRGGAGAIARAELEARARDARGWERLSNALDGYEASLVRLGIQHLPATGDVFRHELSRVLDELGRGAAAARAGTLRVVLLREVAGEPLDHLILLDACEGALPPAPAPDPLLPEALEAELAKGASRMIPANVRRAMDMGALAAAVAAADRTSMVYRARDDDGALAPAPIFAWLERAKIATSEWGSSPIVEHPRSPHERTLKYMHSASEASRAAFLPEVTRRGRIERAREGFFVDPARTPSDILGALDAVASPPRQAALALESGGGERPMGVTDLERWAACPFQGFSQVVLRARMRRRLHELPDPRDHGSFVHEALAAAFEATRDEWSLRPRNGEAILARATAASEAVLTKQGPSSLRELDLVRARASVATVLRMALADERWDFVLAEQSFGEANAARSWPALSLESPEGERALLRGRIDRLDISHDGASLRVVDYKGRQNSASALGVTDLQLPLYAVAAFASLPHAPSAAHAAYVAYSTREKPRTEKQEEAFHTHFAPTLERDDDGVRPVVRRALDILQNARRGSLLPTEGTPCARCEQDGACRKPRFSVPADEKEDD